MELPVALQGLAFFQAVLLGLGLALGYDILRGPRRLWPGCTWLMDFLFGAGFFWSVLWFLLSPGGGEFRLYHAAGILLGAALWFTTLSALTLRLWVRFLLLLRAAFWCLFRPLTNFLKKIKTFAKNSFQLA